MVNGEDMGCLETGIQYSCLPPPYHRARFSSGPFVNNKLMKTVR